MGDGAGTKSQWVLFGKAFMGEILKMGSLRLPLAGAESVGKGL